MTVTITAAMVKELREKSGAGMLDAKNALTEVGGDIEKAMELLRQKGVLSAEKKLGRAAAEGVISAAISADGKQGILLEINCETDFVARGEAFLALVKQVSDQALTSKAITAEALLQEKSAQNKAITVDEYLKENIAVIKENLSIRRLTRYALSKPGFIASYIHTGSKIGVLVQLNVGKEAITSDDSFKQLAKDITLHIASSQPDYLTRSEISADDIEAEKRIELGKEDLQSKPEAIREKIVEGRLDKIFGQRVLLEQPFVKDPSKSIEELVKEVAGKLGTTIEIAQFTRYLLGEGVEKREDNFADEVMAQIKG